MNDTAQIVTLLKDADIPVVGAIVSNPSNPQSYFVPVRLTRRSDGGQSPSGRALALARSNLVALGYEIDFILIDETAENVEESLRGSLISSFPEDVRNSFFSHEKGRPQAWVEFKKQPDAETLRRLQEHLRKFAESFSLPGLFMIQLGETHTATKMEVLAVVRQLAPIDIVTLAKELESQDFSVPSLDWVKRCLDVLRRSALVLRRGDGAYVLTTEALSRLGTRKDRRSPDVRRLLALARRNS